VFAGNDHPEIYSHQRLLEAVPDIGRAGRDGGDQFGMALPDSLYINAGVQMEYGRVTPPTREGYLPPTRTFGGDQLLLTVAGTRLQLLYTPGETADAISVWLPDKRVLMTGDGFLRAFPNISPIRGARLRIPEDWIASLISRSISSPSGWRCCQPIGFVGGRGVLTNGRQRLPP
jgi:glyoxylase-like metal-dependent hydrolase (beta-lactamase superfamily II)